VVWRRKPLSTFIYIYISGFILFGPRGSKEMKLGMGLIWNFAKGKGQLELSIKYRTQRACFKAWCRGPGRVQTPNAILFYSKVKEPQFSYIGGLVDHTASLHVVQKRKICCRHQDSNPTPSSP
jgi:hypothetical protein